MVSNQLISRLERCPPLPAGPLPNGRGWGWVFNPMKESTKKTLKRVAEIVITIITALLTTLGAHAAGIVQ